MYLRVCIYGISLSRGNPLPLNFTMFLQMTVFLVSPFIGIGISRYGVKRTLNVGIGTVGGVLVFYSLLGQLQSGPLFLGLSMGLRY